jgi:hypothetical protein
MKKKLYRRGTKDADVEDWAIRQLRVLGYLDMKQMILVLRVMMHSVGRKRRFSDLELKRLCEQKPIKKRMRSGHN